VGGPGAECSQVWGEFGRLVYFELAAEGGEPERTQGGDFGAYVAPAGHHFIAMDQPGPLAADIRALFARLR